MEEENYNIENIDLTNWKQILNSPRSLQACRKIGVQPMELFFMDFYTFKNTNHEVKNIPREVQNLRYEHYEKLRQDTLAAVKDERRKMINEDKNTFSESKLNVTLYFLNIEPKKYNYAKRFKYNINSNRK